MQLYDFIHSSASRVVFGIIMGLGLASLFRKTCHGRNCMVFKAPDMAETKQYTFKYDGKCFNYNVNSARCDDSRIDVGLWKIKHNVVSIDDGVIQKHQYFSHLIIHISLHHIPSSSQWTGPWLSCPTTGWQSQCVKVASSIPTSDNCEKTIPS